MILIRANRWDVSFSSQAAGFVSAGERQETSVRPPQSRQTQTGYHWREQGQSTDHALVFFTMNPRGFHLCGFLLQGPLDSSPRNPSPVVQNSEKGTFFCLWKLTIKKLKKINKKTFQSLPQRTVSSVPWPRPPLPPCYRHQENPEETRSRLVHRLASRTPSASQKAGEPTIFEFSFLFSNFLLQMLWMFSVVFFCLQMFLMDTCWAPLTVRWRKSPPWRPSLLTSFPETATTPFPSHCKRHFRFSKTL